MEKLINGYKIEKKISAGKPFPFLLQKDILSYIINVI